MKNKLTIEEQSGRGAWKDDPGSESLTFSDGSTLRLRGDQYKAIVADVEEHTIKFCLNQLKSVDSTYYYNSFFAFVSEVEARIKGTGKEKTVVKYLTIDEARDLAAETAKMKERERCLELIRGWPGNLYSMAALATKVAEGDEEDQRKAKEESAEKEREAKLEKLAEQFTTKRMADAGVTAGRRGWHEVSREMLTFLPPEALEAALATVKLP